METLVSAVIGDLISRSISFAVDRCCHRRRNGGGAEAAPQRLRRVLLRIQAVVEEADRRRVTNQAMFRQLQLMREAVYRGYYLLSSIKRHAKAQDHEVSRHDDSSFALSQFNPAKRLCTLSAWMAAAATTTNMASDDTRHEGEAAEEELQEALTGLERMAGDMKELVLFLSCYPPSPTRREPYSAHLWLENRMFGREAEMQRIVSFLLEPEPTKDLGVLPVIGRARVGKSTLVEHVCFDEMVRGHFSLIVFLGDGDIKDGKFSPNHLGDSGIIKHRDLGSSGKSLVVIELDGDVDDENTWWRRTLSALRGHRTTPPVSKIIVTSRSEKIASFGTTQALELKLLPREAFWYFFKTIAFGSTSDAEDQPELVSVCIQMADLLHRSFIAAHLVGGLLKTNPCSQFWQRVLKCYKDYVNRHLVLFGEHPSDLLAKDRPVYLWTLRKIDGVLIGYRCYQASSAQEHDLPKITINEVQFGSARPRGKFEVLVWRSHIPPYYSYMVSCGVQTPSPLLRVPPRNKQIRHRQKRLKSI